MHEFIFGKGKYPYQALWEKRNQALTVDGSITYEGAVPFNYRKVRNVTEKAQDINGLKQIKYSKAIRTREEIPFTAKDRIIIDSRVYEVKESYKVDDETYDSARMIFKNIDEYETEIVLSG